MDRLCDVDTRAKSCLLLFYITKSWELGVIKTSEKADLTKIKISGAKLRNLCTLQCSSLPNRTFLFMRLDGATVLNYFDIYIYVAKPLNK